MDLHIRQTVQKARQRFYELKNILRSQSKTLKTTDLLVIHETIRLCNMELGIKYTHKQYSSIAKQNTENGNWRTVVCQKYHDSQTLRFSS